MPINASNNSTINTTSKSSEIGSIKISSTISSTAMPNQINTEVENYDIDSNLDSKDNSSLTIPTYTSQEIKNLVEEETNLINSEISFYENQVKQNEELIEKLQYLQERVHFLEEEKRSIAVQYQVDYPDKNLDEIYDLVVKDHTEIEATVIIELEELKNDLELDNITLEKIKDFETYEDYQNYIKEVENDIACFNSGIYKYKSSLKTLEYKYLNYNEDYQKYKIKDYNITKDNLLLEVTYGNASQAFKFSYSSYCKKFGYVDEFSFTQAIEKYFPESKGMISISDELLTIEAMAQNGNDEYKKMYLYLYEKEGEKSAQKFLTAIKDEINNYGGKLKAEEFIKNLDENPDKAIEYINNYLKEISKGTNDGIFNWFGNVKNTVDVLFDKDDAYAYSMHEYETMYILQALKEKDYGIADENIYEISQSIGNMIPSILISSATGCPTLGAISMGVPAGGGAAHQGLVEGYSRGQAITYGVLNGISETCLERFLGGISGIGDVNVTSFKTLLQSMEKEAMEESTQSYLDSAFRTGIFNEDYDFVGTSKDAIKSGIYGAISGGIINSAMTGINYGINKDSNMKSENNLEINQNSPSAEVESLTINPSTEQKIEETVTEKENETTTNNISSKIQELLDEWDRDLRYSPAENKYELQGNFIKNKVINGGLSTEEKIEFAEQLIEDNYIKDGVEGYVIFEMMKDDDLLHFLASESFSLDRFVSFNLTADSGASLILPALRKLNYNEVNKLFGSKLMKEGLKNISDEDFIKDFSLLQNNKNTILNETILNRLSNLDEESFYKILDLYSYNISSSLEELLKNNVSIKYYDNFLDSLFNKYNIEEYIFSHPNKLDRIIALFNKLLENEQYVTPNVTKLNELVANVKTTLNNNILSNSEVEIVEKYGIIKVLNQEKNRWYNLEIEVKGENKIYPIQTNYRGEISINAILSENVDMQVAFLNNEAKIKSVTFDENRNKYIVKDVKRGLNRVDAVIDGTKKSFVVNSNSDELDLFDNFPNNSAEDIKVTPLSSPSFNCKVENPDAIAYKLTGTMNGEKVEYYISRDILDKTQLNVDEVIIRNNLYDLKNIEIKEVDFSKEDLSRFNIKKYKASQEIFTDDNYGGNQSTAYAILMDEKLANLYPKKKKCIENVLKKYFPEITDVDMVNIADSYGIIGCNFMAFSNALLTYFGSMENGAKIFKEKFGYDLYYEENGTKNYNFEAIALDCFLNFEKRDTVLETCKKASGLAAIEMNTAFKSFLSEKGIEVTTNNDICENYNKVLGTLLKLNKDENTFYTFNGAHFDMDYISGNLKSLSLDAADSNISNMNKENVGNHSMLITGVTSDGDIIVSSWNKKYKVSKDYFEKYKGKCFDSNGNAEKISTYIYSITFKLKD